MSEQMNEHDQDLAKAAEEHKKRRAERKWYAVIGYADRYEVMDGADYHANPPLMRTKEHPEGWVMVQVVESEDAPNEATAVAKAVTNDLYDEIQIDLIGKLLYEYLDREDWYLDANEAEKIEALDRFIVKAGGDSVLGELVKQPTDRITGYVEWVNPEDARPVEPDSPVPEPNSDQLSLELD